MHKVFAMKLLYFTAYHLQIDSASEQTNQTAKIALQFYLYTINWSKNWPKVLPQIQSLINNTEPLSTIKTPNKVAFGLTSNWLLDLLAGSIKVNHKIAQVEVKSVISFAQVNFKHYYDHSHQLINLKINNFALLYLHKRYSISLTLAITKKLIQQYVSFFRVLEKIKKLAYQLNILTN